MTGQQHPTAALSRGVDTLAQALALWAERDETKAQPEVREAANTAVGAIDRMLADLHRIRSGLVAEVRQSDDASAARVDAMLAERRDGDR